MVEGILYSRNSGRKIRYPHAEKYHCICILTETTHQGVKIADAEETEGGPLSPGRGGLASPETKAVCPQNPESRLLDTGPHG